MEKKPTFEAYAIECGMVICNTQTPNMCLYSMHYRAVRSPSFWCLQRCHLRQQLINNGTHVDILDDIYAMVLHNMGVFLERYTSSCLSLT